MELEQKRYAIYIKYLGFHHSRENSLLSRYLGGPSHHGLKRLSKSSARSKWLAPKKSTYSFGELPYNYIYPSKLGVSRPQALEHNHALKTPY